MVLLVHFNWAVPVPSAGASAYLGSFWPMPIVWSAVLLVPLALAYLRFSSRFSSKSKLPEQALLESGQLGRWFPWVPWFALYFAEIFVLRTLVIWKFGGPYEKVPLALLALLHVGLVERRSPAWCGLHGNQLWRNVAYGASLVLVLLVVLAPLLWFPLLEPGPASNAAAKLQPPEPLVLVSFPFQLLAVGLSEELFFRGWLYSHLRASTSHWRRWGRAFSLFAACSLFGAFHLPWYLEPAAGGLGVTLPAERAADAAARVLSTGAFGLLACLAYERTRSLAGPVVLHALFNTVGAFAGSALLGLSESDALAFASAPGFVPAAVLALVSAPAVVWVAYKMVGGLASALGAAHSRGWN
ncbi:MAG: hypothetical protein Kow0069_36320 [Promethearchaeota archaeon]